MDAPRTDGTSGSPPRSAAWTRAEAADPVLVADLTRQLDRRVHDEDSLLDLMNRASSEAVRIPPPTSSAGVTAQFAGDPFTAVYTDVAALLIDEGQYDQNDGPCLRAMRTDESVVMTLAAVSETWPQVAEAAHSVGVTSFRAEPLHVDRRSVGSLNLYSDSAVGLGQIDADLLTVVTEFLGQGLTEFSVIYPGEVQAYLLRAVVYQRDLISQAVGVLMAQHQTDPPQARLKLADRAEQAGTDLASAARQVVDDRAGPNRSGRA